MARGENSSTGTTTNDYVAIVTLPGISKRIVIAVKNTGLNDMMIKVTNKHFTGGSIEITEIEDITVTANSYIRYVESKLTAEITFYVKSAIAGAHTTYNTEYGMGSI